MKKPLPLLAVTALSAELFLARTAHADEVPAPAPTVEAGSGAASLVASLGSAVSALASRLCHTAAAPKPAPAPVPPSPRPPSGNGKRSCYDDEGRSC